MSLSIRALRSALVGLALLGPLIGVPHASAQSVTSEETVRSSAPVRPGRDRCHVWTAAGHAALASAVLQGVRHHRIRRG